MSVVSRGALFAIVLAACSSPEEATSPAPVAAPSLAPAPVVAAPSAPVLPLLAPSISDGPPLRADPLAPVPRVHLEDATVDRPTALSPDAVRRRVQQHINELLYCYEVEVIDVHDLRGRIEARWRIGPDGTVSNASVVSSTLASPTAGETPARRVEACTLAAISRWPFPAPDGATSVTVTCPFAFAMEVPPPPASPVEPPSAPAGEGLGLGPTGTAGS